MSDEQRTLSNFAEAEKVDMVNSKYFKPEVNVPYELTFGNIKDSPDAAHPHYKLVEKSIPDFNNPSLKVKKVVLILQVESIDGTATSQEWSILSANLRKTLETPCTSGMLVKKKYRLKASGEGKNKTYTFSEVGDK